MAEKMRSGKTYPRMPSTRGQTVNTGGNANGKTLGRSGKGPSVVNNSSQSRSGVPKR